ncbi:MAG: type II CAAX endopeptidase family protein [Candidatus Micrarchaeota archaeon]
MGALRFADIDKLVALLVFASAVYLISIFTIGFLEITRVAEIAGAGVIVLLILQELVFRGILLEKFGIWIQALVLACLLAVLCAHSYVEAVALFVYGFASSVVLALLKKERGLLLCVLAGLVYLVFFLATVGNPYFATGVLSLFLLLFPFYYLRRSSSWKEVLETLGLRREGLLKNILLGIALLFASYAMLIVVALTLGALGYADQELVQETVSGLPVYLLVFAVVFAPFAEEIFFRGFLTPRIGIIGSSVVFALAHFQYGAISEIVATLCLGLLFAYARKRTNSVVAPMVAHVIINLVSIIVIKTVGAA